MIQLFNKLLKLTLIEWVLLFLAIPFLYLTQLILKISGFNRTRSLFNTINYKINRNQPTTENIANNCGRLVQSVANHTLWKTTCLERALTTWLIMKLFGISTDLKIGVAKNNDELNAHAWVEQNGAVIINDLGDEHKTSNTFHLNKC